MPSSTETISHTTLERTERASDRRASQSLRIALFHNSPGGGAKRAAYELAEGLIKHGHVVDGYVLSTGNEEYLPLRALGMRVSMIPVRPRPHPPALKPFLLERYVELAQVIGHTWDHARLMRRLAAQIDAAGYDVVWVDKCHLFAASFLLRYLKTPSVYYCHEPWRSGYEPLDDAWWYADDSLGSPLRRLYTRIGNGSRWLQRAYRRRIDRCNARAATRIATNSQYTQAYIASAYGVTAQVSYLGVNTSTFKPLGNSRQRLVLWVGYPGYAWKRFALAVEAIGTIPAAHRPALVAISPRSMEECVKDVDALASRHQVTITVRVDVPEAELMNWYNRAGVVLYTAMGEPFGLVAIEAMACGTPVVAVREGGLQETIMDGVTGFLVAPTPEAFAAAIQRVLDDPALQAQMGAAGIEHVQRSWAWDAAVKRFERHVYDVAQRSQS